MPSKLNFKRLFLRRRHSAGSDAQKPSGRNLTNLPPEILLTITDYLGPSDRASLILCNHAVLRALGTKDWSSLAPGQANDGYRESFLTALSRDLPGHFFCHDCSRLHPSKRFGPPGPALQPRKALRCVEKRSVRKTLRSSVNAHQCPTCYEFAFPHLQLAMKRHRHGPGHGISTESLSFTELQVWPRKDGTGTIHTLVSVEARICSAPISLCLRIQQWAFFDPARPAVILSETWFVRLCNHLGRDSPVISRLIMSKLEPGQRGMGPDLRKCRCCNMDYHMKISDFGDRGVALVITKWLDLGPGMNPRDMRWKAHTQVSTIAELPGLGEAGDVRLRFESEPGLSEESLSTWNASHLIEKRYRSSMDHWSYNRWILQANKRLSFWERFQISQCTPYIGNVLPVY